MYEDTKKMMTDYKINLFMLDEEMRTSRLKMCDMVGAIYDHISPKIKTMYNNLTFEINKATKENGTLRTQINTLAEEESDISALTEEYYKRLDKLQNTIHG